MNGTIRTVLIQLDVTPPSDAQQQASDTDVRDAMLARLSEFYPTEDGEPWQPWNVRIAVTDPAAAQAVISGANVALDGADEDTTGFPATVLDDAAAAAEALSKCHQCGLRAGHTPDCANGRVPR